MVAPAPNPRNVPLLRDRSMNENARLADIVEAVKSLEQAVIKDSGIPCKWVNIDVQVYYEIIYISLNSKDNRYCSQVSIRS